MPAINGRRDEYVIASKLRNLRRPDGTPTARGRPEYVKAACERSLRRLRTEFLDLSYIHRVDPTVPIEDTVGAMSELAQDRKVRFLGISEAGPQTVRRAHATHPVSAVQIEYSLWTRDVEAGMLDLCRELGIGFVGYSPLGRGFLTGTVTGRADLEAGDARRRMQPSTCRGVAQARGSRKMHAGAAVARLDSIPRHLDRADRRHQLPALGGGERRRIRHQDFRGDARCSRGNFSTRRRCRGTVPRSVRQNPRSPIRGQLARERQDGAGLLAGSEFAGLSRVSCRDR